MFIKVTCVCGSRDVMHFKQNGTRLDQYCKCGNNLTAPQIRKQVRTRRLNASKRAKTAIRRTQSPNVSYAVGLVFWAILAGFYLLVSPAVVTYAREPEIIPVLTPIEPIQPKPELTTKEEIRDYVLAEAKEAGVHVAKIAYIVENESHYNPEAVGDTHLTCKRTGKPIRARGIFQITDCWHPEVSDEQAHSVEWSTKWALTVIAKSKRDCISQWTTCRNWYR